MCFTVCYMYVLNPVISNKWLLYNNNEKCSNLFRIYSKPFSQIFYLLYSLSKKKSKVRQRIQHTGKLVFKHQEYFKFYFRVETALSKFSLFLLLTISIPLIGTSHFKTNFPSSLPLPAAFPLSLPVILTLNIPWHPP